MSETSTNTQNKKEIFPFEENVNAILRLKPSIYYSESYINCKSNIYDKIYDEYISNRRIYDNTVLPYIKSFMRG